MQDERERKQRLITIRSNERNAAELLVIAMRFHLPTDPAQDEAHRLHMFNLHSVRIERVFARRQRFTPDTAASRLDLFTIAELRTRNVVTGITVIANDNADIANRGQPLRTP